MKLLTVSSLDLKDGNGIWINVSPVWGYKLSPPPFSPTLLQITTLRHPQLNWHPQTNPKLASSLPFGALALCSVGGSPIPLRVEGKTRLCRSEQSQRQNYFPLAMGDEKHLKSCQGEGEGEGGRVPHPAKSVLQRDPESPATALVLT